MEEYFALYAAVCTAIEALEATATRLKLATLAAEESYISRPE